VSGGLACDGNGSRYFGNSNLNISYRDKEDMGTSDSEPGPYVDELAESSYSFVDHPVKWGPEPEL